MLHTTCGAPFSSLLPSTGMKSKLEYSASLLPALALPGLAFFLVDPGLSPSVEKAFALALQRDHTVTEARRNPASHLLLQVDRRPWLEVLPRM